MAAPQITEVLQKSRDKILVYFDQPLDSSVEFPSTCFSINYGKIPISGADYYGTAGILILLDQEMTHRDKLEINYQPPENIDLALRSPAPDGATNLFLRRSAVRGFFKVPVKNLLAPDESTWAANSNLGGGKRAYPQPGDPEYDGSIPGFDICGDGSLIIGNPGNIINDKPDGEILSITVQTKGTGYSYAGSIEIYPTGGSGSGAVVNAIFSNGQVDSLSLVSGGKGYKKDEILYIPFGENVSLGEEATLLVTDAVDLYAEAAAAGVIPTSGGTEPPRIQDLPYPVFDRPTPRAATPDDFVLAYGLREAIQITNIDDADASQPNTEKLWMAIEDAAALIDNYIHQATRAGKLLISSNRRRTTLIISRYYLDTVRRREDVKADYERCISELDKARSLEDGIRPDLPWWADPCNPNRGQGIRSHRIPQYYNGVSGKGLDGWWVDSSAEEAIDIRQSGQNSQNNNNLTDSASTGAGGSSISREPNQPTDEGGFEPGGE